MTQLLQRIHERIGDLWWYTALLFCAQRFGDVINMFVGLWLVPKFVPMEELGAVLPLSQFVSVIGLPLGIIAVPFMKYLNVYAERNELGKVKSLLRDGFIGTGILALFSFLIAYFLLPHIFERMRVAAGSLGVLIVFVSILTSISVIFGNAVQGLKLYSATVWFNVLAAPLRLLLMAVFMPFRPLSGYFIGQAASPGVSVIGALWSLRKKLGRTVKAVPYWKEDGRAMIRYAIPVFILNVLTVCCGSIDSLIIRHRLPDFESAGYYILTRFTDISSYLGSVFIVFLFPMVAGKERNDADSLKILFHSSFGTIACGIIVAVLLFVCGNWVLGLQPLWAQYAPLSVYMPVICIINALLLASACYTTYEMAQNRFGFLKWMMPIVLIRVAFLYAITGFRFFDGILPSEILRSIEDFNPNRLSFVLFAFLAERIVITCGCVGEFLVKRRGATHG